VIGKAPCQVILTAPPAKAPAPEAVPEAKPDAVKEK
jgi:hypothetical protein